MFPAGVIGRRGKQASHCQILPPTAVLFCGRLIGLKEVMTMPNAPTSASTRSAADGWCGTSRRHAWSMFLAGWTTLLLAPFAVFSQSNGTQRETGKLDRDGLRFFEQKIRPV